MDGWYVDAWWQTPGLYKIFDEIIVNASDNKQRDPSMDTIRVDIDQVRRHHIALLTYPPAFIGIS